MKFWKKTIFWSNVTKTLALFGPTGGVIAGKYTDDPFRLTVGMVCVGLAAAIAIWMADKDNNGIVDLFE